MKISLEWLSEYVDIAGLAPEAIAEALTNSGLEIEGIHKTGGAFTNVVVAKCEKLDPHPNADKLRLATVNIGSATQQVVCGAPNLKEGMMIAFAKEGAQVINRKDGTLFTLGKAKIRGVESCGMICSIEELGLQEQYPNTEDGIWPIAQYADESKLGKDLKEVLGLKEEIILESAPTANRGDQMSMIGVAREVAALFNRKLTLPVIKESAGSGKTDLKVSLSDETLCRYYGGVVVKGVTIKPSPEAVQRRLAAAGVRSINNVVDVTNYVMLEMGQPLHAFDADKLGASGTLSGTIDVRRGKAGEKFKTLDDAEVTLSPESVAVVFNDKPVALGGVMGGLETAMDEASRNLVLEAAYFDPANNRKSGKSVGIRTESSARFERGVDLGMTRLALYRAAQLVCEWAGGEVVALAESPVPNLPKPEIELRLSRYQRVIGMPVEATTVETILPKLGFAVSKKDADTVVVTVPTFRQHDVSREIDVIEELVRIVGYDNVPYTLPRKTGSVPFSVRQQLLGKLHHTLTGLGLYEVMTTSLIGEALLEKTGFRLDENQLVTVTNSHSSDHTKMRQSLIPNLVEVAKYNQSQGIEHIWVYELGRTYFKVGKATEKQSGVSEKLHVSGLITGNVAQGQWHQKAETDFYTLKGIVEALLSAVLPDEALAFEADGKLPYAHPGKTARVKAGGKDLGVVGELHPLQRERLKFRQPVFFFELNVETIYKLLKQKQAGLQEIKISPYPAVDRDVAFVAAEALTHRQITEALNHAGEKLLKNIDVFDEFRSEKLGAGKRSLAYRFTFQSDEATLTDAQIDAAMTSLRKILSDKLGVEFR